MSQSIAAITGSDLSGYATTQSVNQLSESVAQSIAGINIPDVSIYATTASLNALSESVYTDHTALGNVAQRANQAYSTANLVKDTYATTQSLNNVSQSLSASIAAITGSSVDLSGYATTASLNAFSESIANDFGDRFITDSKVGAFLESIGLAYQVEDMDGNQVWAAGISDELGNIPEEGEGYFWENAPAIWRVLASVGAIDFDDESEDSWSISRDKLYDLSQLVTDLSASVAEMSGSSVDLSGYLTTASYQIDSASFDQRINSISSSGAGQDTELRQWMFGTASISGNGHIDPTSSCNFVWEISQSEFFYTERELGEGKSILVVVHNNSTSSADILFNEDYHGPLSVVNGVLGSGSCEVPAEGYTDIVATQIGNKIYFRTSLDLSDLPTGSVDLSGYATTQSLNSVSESLSASIAAITSSGGGGGTQDLLDLGLAFEVTNPSSSEQEVQAGYTYANLQEYIPSFNPQNFYGIPFSGSGDFWKDAPAIWRILAQTDFVDLLEYNQTTTWEYDPQYGSREVPVSWSVSKKNLAGGNYLDKDTGGTVTGKVTITNELEVGSTTGQLSNGSAIHLAAKRNSQIGNSDIQPNSIVAGTEISSQHGFSGPNVLSWGYNNEGGGLLPYTIFLGENNGVEGIIPGQLYMYNWGMALEQAVRSGNGYARPTVMGNFNILHGVSAASQSSGNDYTIGRGYYDNIVIVGISGSVYERDTVTVGTELQNAHRGQVVLGRNNVEDTGSNVHLDSSDYTNSGSYAVVIGAGRNDANRINGAAFKWDSGYMDIPYSGSTVTLQDKIAQLEQGSVTIVTTLNSGSTDSEVPSAKCVYDLIGDIEAALAALR